MRGKSGWRKAQPPSSALKMKGGMSELDLDELRAELDDFAQPVKKGGRSPREERVIAGFEEIQHFVEQHGRAPSMAKVAIFSSASTPSASIACGILMSADRFLNRSITRA